MADSAVDWICAAHESLLTEQWPHFSAIYDRRTGETHILSALPAEILRLLRGGARSETAIIREIAQDHDLVIDADWQANVHKSLMHLRSLGLVEQTPK